MSTIPKLVGAFLLFTVLVIFRVNGVTGGTAYDDAEAYRVYSAILPNEWSWRDAKASTLVIRVETAPFTMCIEPDKESEKIFGSAIKDYEKINKKRWLLQRRFEIEKPYELISSEEIATTFSSRLEDGGWGAFYERHPDSGGWIELSAVGFNSSKTIAVPYAGHHCHLLCGGGTFHFLRKADGRWLPLQLKGGRFCSWVT
jgi:hypothetical protein